MKTILLIGLGRFGTHMAEKLRELNNEVMAIDLKEENVNAVLDITTTALIGDCTDERFMSTLGVRNFDMCVVAIGNNFQSSLIITSILKDLGAKYIFARASTEIHAKFLLRNGADKIVYVEKEMAYKAAIKCSSNYIFDIVSLTHEHSICEISTPSDWVGMSIAQKAVRTKYHISILAVKHDDVVSPLPGPDYVFTGMETLIVLAENKALQKF